MTRRDLCKRLGIDYKNKWYKHKRNIETLLENYLISRIWDQLELSQKQKMRDYRIGLTFLFNRISTFVGHLMLKPSIWKNSSGTI